MFGHGIMKTLDRHMETLDRHERLLAELQSKVASLEAENKVHAIGSHENFDMRRRFYDIYKQNKGNKAYGNTDAIPIRNTDAIQTSNALARYGNALQDAELFDKDLRGDFSTYRELYGLEHGQVQKFSMSTVNLAPRSKLTGYTIDLTHPVNDGGFFTAINLHATILARRPGEEPPVTPEFHEAWVKFVEAVEEIGFSFRIPTIRATWGVPTMNFWKLREKSRSILVDGLEPCFMCIISLHVIP